MRFRRWRLFVLITLLFFLVIGIGFHAGSSGGYAAQSSAAFDTATAPSWTLLASGDGVVPVSGPTEQTLGLAFDIDRDGVEDIVIGGRKIAPALTWYRRVGSVWQRFVIEDEMLPIEAGGAFYDIDGDGDLDLVAGEDFSRNRLYWWENPYPNYDPDVTWNRYTIKNSGQRRHHDQLIGDFDGDGRAELVFWTKGSGATDSVLNLAEIPDDPKGTQPWPYTQIYSSPQASEGLASADIDGDGVLDIIAAGRWFSHAGGGEYTPHVIDATMHFTRAAAGQLIHGGRPEVVFGAGDEAGPLRWYAWHDGTWVGTPLVDGEIDRGHSLEIGDINGDGYLDIFVAEMRLNGGNQNALTLAFLGDGLGRFTRTEVAIGADNHESRLADLDGDGDLDIFGKPYNYQTPGVNIWINNTRGAQLLLNRWQRHVVDTSRPYRAIFIAYGDLDGDGLPDLISGGWWYRNPGTPGGSWKRTAFGEPLRNMAAVADLDGDGDLDVIGTQGRGSERNDRFAWGRNDGAGNFTIFTNIAEADGDFLQGVAVAQLQPNGPLDVALSWHAAGKGVQALRVPANPAVDMWEWRQLSPVSQDEAVSAADLDGDGDLDLVLGTRWLRNDGDGWIEQQLSSVDGDPDRNSVADINGDRRLDVVIGFEAIGKAGKLAWYAQGANPSAEWTETVIGAPIGPMSLDVADLDGDGDLDVIVGEHDPYNPGRAALVVYENVDGRGREWVRQVIHTGDEHHNGALLVDIDNDGDLDIVSIGWSHNRVLLYENRAPRPFTPAPGETIEPPFDPGTHPPDLPENPGWIEDLPFEIFMPQTLQS
jgi:hypothetical protein